MTRPLSDLTISRRTRALLVGAGIQTVEALCEHTAASLRKISRFGVVALREVREELAAKGLALAGEERPATAVTCLGCKAGAPIENMTHSCQAGLDVALQPCGATAHDAGTGGTLTCARLQHADNEYHVADGMRWRDGEPPRGFMGGRR